MRRLILEEWLSLDGFAADKNGKLDFFPSSETDRFSDRDQLNFLDSVDTILLGRKTYQLFVQYWPTATADKEIIADRLNTLPKLVFFNTLTETPWAEVAPRASRSRRRHCRDHAAESGRWEAHGPLGEPLPGSGAHRIGHDR
jgi:dihydrofolate reductase